MRPNPLDLSFIPQPARLSLPGDNSPPPACAASPQTQDGQLRLIPHSSSSQLPSTSSQAAFLQPSNSFSASTSEAKPPQVPILLDFNPDSPFSPVSSTPSGWDHLHIAQSNSQDRPTPNHHVPQPLKLVPTSFRRSISAPFTTSAIASLEFPPNVRLHSITEDGYAMTCSQPTPTFQTMNSLQTPTPFSGPHLPSPRLPFEPGSTTSPLDPSGTHEGNLQDTKLLAVSTSPNPSQSGQHRKWVSNFYVWVYDSPSSFHPVPPPSPTSALSPSATSNLSNQLMGGLSKHFFNNSFKQSSSSLSKPSASKKDRRVKGLISGLTKPKETSSLDSRADSTFGNDHHNFDHHTLSAAEQQTDSFIDKSEPDGTHLAKTNQNRFSSNSKSNDPLIKPKRNSTPAEPNKLGRKRFVPGFGGGGGILGTSPSSPNTGQLALGPGPAMNSRGVGAGHWKLVQGVIAEDGQFTLYSTDDTPLYQIHLPSYRRTDIRIVHQSIFGRLHCGVITRRAGNPGHSSHSQSSPNVHNSTTFPPLQSSSSLPSIPAVGSLSTQLTGTATVPSASVHPAPSSPKKLNETVNNVSSSTTPSLTHQQAINSHGTTEVPIYVCMPNLVLLESWLVICKCFCRPDDFRHLYPRSNKKNQVTSNKAARNRNRSLTNNHASSNQTLSPLVEQPSSPNLGGGDSGSIRGPAKQGLPERVRIWRGVEIQLVEGRKLGEYNQITVNNVLEVGNEPKAMLQEERRNSTGGYLPGSSQASLLSINKELLFNKSSNFGKHQTAQQFIINDPSFHQHKDHPSLQYRNKPKTNEESNVPATGFSVSSTPSLDMQGGQVTRQNLKNLDSLHTDSYHNDNSSASLPAIPNKSSTAPSFVLPSLPNESSGNHSKHHSNSSVNDNFYFVEFDWDKEVVGRSTIKRNSNPFWKEEFKFSEIGSFKTLMVLNVYQIKKNINQSLKSVNQHANSNSPTSTYSSKIQLIGQTQLDFKNIKKNLQLQVWLPVYPHNYNSNHNSDENHSEIGDENLNSFDESKDHSIFKKVAIVGEIHLSITVFEQVVLAESEYSQMMSMLNNDSDIELPLHLANVVLGDLDRLAELLIRIYESSNRLVLRLSQLAAIEINGDLSTASILFRANTLLTKMLEAYMRMVGGPFLELSIGSVVRRICTGKVELEIDPSKLKSSISSSQREKTISENTKELHKLALEIWQSMYINRSKCPNRLRKIFVKIQEYVGNAYDDQDMRLTSISAFIFLRFFVPAILNPRLFNLIQFQPDSKSQRTLTLLAKTLQGLGNLTLFGIKEPWMSVMNEFITTQLDSFRDYISYISRESDSTKPEWTSKEYEGYGLPYALRTSLPASCRDGIPSLPHLLDPVRDCSLLANLIVVTQRKSSGSDHLNGNHSSSVLPSNRPRRKTPVSESFPISTVDGNHQSSTEVFLTICEELHAKSERRCLKIIQSESKSPAGNKPSSITNTTVTNPVSTSIAATQGSSPTNLNGPVHKSSPQDGQDIINSRKCLVQQQHVKLSPPLALPATTALTPPSHGSSSSSITRWKRSHTVSAEHIAGSSSSSNSPRSPNIQHPNDTVGSHHHQLVGATDSPRSLTFSSVPPSSLGFMKTETTGFVLQNRSPRSKTVSSPNPFVDAGQSAARQGLFSQFEIIPAPGQTVLRQDVHNSILNDEIFTNENRCIKEGNLDQTPQSSSVNSRQPHHLTLSHHDRDEHPVESNIHLVKIRSLSRKGGFKLIGPNHLTGDFQSLSQQHPPEVQEKKNNETNSIESSAGSVDGVPPSRRINAGRLSEKTSKTSFNNQGGNLNKESRSSSSLSLSSLVSASSSSSFCSVTQNLRKNLKLHHFNTGLNSKLASPVIHEDYTSTIESSAQATLPSPPSSSSRRSSDTPYFSCSQRQLPSSSGSKTITIPHKQHQEPSSLRYVRQEDAHVSSTQSAGGTSNTSVICTPYNFSMSTDPNLPPPPPPHHHHGNNHYDFSNHGSSTNSSASDTSHKTSGVISSPAASIIANATTTAFSLSATSSSSTENSHHHHRKGFIQKMLRKNSVARS